MVIFRVYVNSPEGDVWNECTQCIHWNTHHSILFFRSNQIPLERPGRRGACAADAGAGGGCFSRAGPWWWLDSNHRSMK